MHNHTSESILKSTQTKTSQFQISVFSGLYPNSFEMLFDKNNKELPHTMYVGPDDIWCSCIGFTFSLKEGLLCKHLVIGFMHLTSAGLLNVSDASIYLCSWKERQQDECSTSREDTNKSINS